MFPRRTGHRGRKTARFFPGKLQDPTTGKHPTICDNIIGKISHEPGMSSSAASDILPLRHASNDRLKSSEKVDTGQPHTSRAAYSTNTKLLYMYCVHIYMYIRTAKT